MGDERKLPARALERAPGDGGALTERVLDAAREQFMTFGLRRSTVDDVAKRAGVSRVTVYRRVGNKDELVQRVLLREYRQFVAEVDAAVAGLPTMEERMVEGFAAVLRLIRGHPLIGGLMRLEPETMLPYLTVESGPSFLAMRGYLAGHLRRARRVTGEEGDEQESGDPVAVAELMVRITVSFLLNPVSCFELDDDEKAREFARRYLMPLLNR
ncbi:TetR/AcrR family transcriptional regulator [Streptomyces yunnanensis]|uniref:TetR/AcrR family transcriptional regulator n=1 Tax=Streptomyces yunnanensis TaxID=156453 RepID=A0ABY8A371_9ACTN|nr:TetR/AcrR family transcriptional regulator [Streptomyces yunnanensis]WEB39380.1 TetR/AcrR family transcriptional regulator [Streptomyces yunnanensis]